MFLVNLSPFIAVYFHFSLGSATVEASLRILQIFFISYVGPFSEINFLTTVSYPSPLFQFLKKKTLF